MSNNVSLQKVTPEEESTGGRFADFLTTLLGSQPDSKA